MNSGEKCTKGDDDCPVLEGTQQMAVSEGTAGYHYDNSLRLGVRLVGEGIQEVKTGDFLPLDADPELRFFILSGESTSLPDSDADGAVDEGDNCPGRAADNCNGEDAGRPYPGEGEGGEGEDVGGRDDNCNGEDAGRPYPGEGEGEQDSGIPTSDSADDNCDGPSLAAKLEIYNDAGCAGCDGVDDDCDACVDDDNDPLVGTTCDRGTGKCQ